MPATQPGPTTRPGAPVSPYVCVFSHAKDHASTAYRCNGASLGRGVAGFERMLALLSAAPAGTTLRLTLPLRLHTGGCDCIGAPWEEKCTASKLKPRFDALVARRRLALVISPANAPRVSMHLGVRGAYPKERLARVIGQHLAAIEALYRRDPAPLPEGKLVVLLTLRESPGEIVNVRLASSELHRPELERAIGRLLATIKVPSGNMALITSITLTLRFRRPSVGSPPSAF